MYKHIKRKSALLQPNEHKENIKLDEIHIQSNVVYQKGKLVEHEENQNVKSANIIQCCMLSSMLL